MAALLPGLHVEFLERCINSTDLKNTDCLSASMDAAELVRHMSTILRWGFASLALDQVTIKKNVAHCVRSTPHTVVLRGLNSIVRRSIQISSADRDTVIRRIQTVLREGVAHRVYKFDIRSFFESLDSKSLFAELSNKANLPRSAIIVLRNYLDELRERGIRGVPRGVPLSATLSEFALQEFDKRVSMLPDVYFHARYVDDIIIVTGARENSNDFVRVVRDLLPQGLEFNASKTKLVDLPVQLRSDGTTILGSFDYLGYRFDVHETSRNSERRLQRLVDISISDKKLKRIKSRLSFAANAFARQGDIGTFDRQLQLLTGNYNVRDVTTGRKRNVGLYCNYRRLTDDACLHELDSYLRSLLVGDQSRIAKRIAAAIPSATRRSLVRYSFAKSFASRTFYSFSPSEIHELRRCWRPGAACDTVASTLTQVRYQQWRI